MCGITGILNLANQKPINRQDLQAANDTLYHRGPDDEGLYFESNFGMAMRRLSIIDLVGGHQPISSEDGNYHICYNGEIYNFKDLRMELQKLGHQFRTESDTEVVLQAYIEWGPERSLEKLRGMFAFAIWDSRMKKLFLARDRMGIKPLYFAEYNGRLYFASEIRGILQHSKMPREVNLEALNAFLRVGFVSTPNSLFRGIQKFLPAHYIIVEDGRISTYKYWELNFETTLALSEKDIVDQFFELLRESVEMHLISDVPIGALLSGGIDSITNVALMQKMNQQPINTICIGFEDSSFNEAEEAADAAHAIGTEHTNVTFTENTLDEYPTTLYYREEPTADSTFSAFYYLFKACRQNNLKVVLSGEGADELLGGYGWHRWEHWVNPLISFPPFLRFLLTVPLIPYSRRQGGTMLTSVIRNGKSETHQRYQDYLSIGDSALANGLLTAEFQLAINRNGMPRILDSWSQHLSPVAKQPSFDQLLWLQSRTRMVDWVNHSIDRMSMAHSVEARPPFMDHKLWEFCAAIHHSLKMGGSYIKPVEKYLLRQAGKNLVPENARHRRKKGIEVPHASWLSQSRLPDWAENALSKAQLKKFGFFDPAAVLTLRREHQAGATGRATLLMGALAVQTWAHLFIESLPESGPPVSEKSQ